MQSSNTVLLIRPYSFGFNVQTADSNAFQKLQHNLNTAEIDSFVQKEFENFVSNLQSKGINSIVIDDTPSPLKPDAVFPNNWISFHSNGTVVLYPMLAENRRLERRIDIIELPRNNYLISNLIDLSYNENENVFLEGTGSIVFDYNAKIDYACL